MSKLTEIIDKKERTITLETDYAFTAFSVRKVGVYFHFDFIKSKHESMGASLFFNRFNGRRNYPKQIAVDNIDTKNKTVKLSYS